jgi:hypothetical protein
MPLIRQSVKKNSRSNDLIINAGDLLILEAIMEGKISVYEKRSVGGVDIATAPAVMRAMKFGVSRRADGLSCTVNFKHIKATKHAGDVFAHQALFDADYATALKATKINMIYQGAK